MLASWLLAAVALAGCGTPYEWNHKITVNVLTPEGEVSASSVQEVRYRVGDPDGWSPGGSRWKVNGEAVVLELPNGRYLFALLQGHDNTGGSSGAIHHIF